MSYKITFYASTYNYSTGRKTRCDAEDLVKSFLKMTKASIKWYTLLSHEGDIDGVFLINDITNINIEGIKHD